MKKLFLPFALSLLISSNAYSLTVPNFEAVKKYALENKEGVAKISLGTLLGLYTVNQPFATRGKARHFDDISLRLTFLAQASICYGLIKSGLNDLKKKSSSNA